MGLRDALEVFSSSAPFERLLLARERPVLARADAGDAFVVAALAVGLDAPVLAVAPGPHEAEALAADLEAFLPGDVVLLPAWEGLPYEGISPAPEIAARRAAATRRLREAQGPFIAVAPVLAAMQGLIPTLGGLPPLELVAGRELAPDDLAERLVELGYRRIDLVEHRGEFAVRGGVLDVFPGVARRPVRLEYWGDEISSVREFSRTSTGQSWEIKRRQRRPDAVDQTFESGTAAFFFAMNALIDSSIAGSISGASYSCSMRFHSLLARWAASCLPSASHCS